MFAMPDIAFLLLIFLILTVSVTEDDGIEIPSFEFTQETDFPNILPVTISREGAIKVDGESLDIDELDRRLSLVAANTVVHIIADRETEYTIVDTLLSALKEAELRDVVLIATIEDAL